jgi:hypothetical protein
LKFPQNQASQADHSANLDVHDPATRRFICQLLGDTGFEWDHKDSNQTVRHLNSTTPRPTAHLLHAAQVVFRFRLLDIYARVFGFGVSDRVVYQIVRPPGGARRLAQVRICMSLLSAVTYLWVRFTSLFKTGTKCFSTSTSSTLSVLCANLLTMMLSLLLCKPLGKTSNSSFLEFNVYAPSVNSKKI